MAESQDNTLSADIEELESFLDEFDEDSSDAALLPETFRSSPNTF